MENKPSNKIFIAIIAAIIIIAYLVLQKNIFLYAVSTIFVLYAGYLLYKKYPKLKNPDVWLTVIFFSLLIVPIIKIDLSQISQTENRVLAQFPTKINHDFGKNFDSWFNDRFFGRDTIINLSNKIKIFNSKIENNKAFMGKDNWLFYKENNSILNYTNTQTLSDAKIQAITQYVSDINEWCKKHNKQFYFIIAPDKNKIYPEYYPDYISKKRSDDYGLGNQFTKYIKENTDVNVVYLYKPLIQEKHKSDTLLYYKHDTHWNNYGAEVGFKYIYKIITGHDWKEDKYIKTWKTEQNRGDLANMLGHLSSKVKDTYSYPVPEFYKDIKFSNSYMYNNEHGLTESINPEQQKNIFILRDSFSSMLQNYFAQSFNTVTMHWTYKISEDMLKQIDDKYDIVILEVVERFIPNLYNLEFPKD